MPRRLLQMFASLKLTVYLLIALAVFLAAATIVESRRGPEAAQQLYYGVAHTALLALFALNVVCAIALRWPWGRERIGFLLTHGSILLILAGALVTLALKQEGQLALWEGEERQSFVSRAAPQQAAALPFAVRLDDFQIDVYPGTQRPAMFRSRVTVRDPQSGRWFPYAIEMNRELSFRGWRLFQSSYQRTPQGEMTILSVSRDPGQPIVFAGYVLLVGGMTTVLATRIRQRRRLGARQPAASPAKALGRRAAALLLAVLGGAVAAAAPARAAAPLASDLLERLQALPVQHDGRVMPLDTLARESLRSVTGRRAWQQEDPVATVLGWSFAAREWDALPMVRIGSARLATAVGLPATTARASFRELVDNRRLLDLFRESHDKAGRDEPLSPVLSDASELEERLVTLQSFFQGEAILAQPAADPVAAWSPLAARDAAELQARAADIRASGPANYPLRADMQRELTYNRRRPTRLAWWLLLPASLAAALAVHRDRRWLDRSAAAGILAGFAVITWGIATRWQIAGRIPAANMYESMLFLSWGVALFAGAAALLGRSRIVVLNGAAMAALAALLVDVLPMDPFVHPVPPVLSGTPWLAIHVPIIMVGYAVCALAMLVAHVQVGVAAFAPQRSALAARLHDLLYWYLHAGSILLVTGILTGSIWAASSWGRYWGWDPKEVWSLVAFLAYMAILHARWERMVGPFGVAVSAIAAFWAILMTYVGVNFILASGLHSYGFASSRVTQWLLAVAVAEILFLGTAAMARRRPPQPGLPAPI